MSILNIYFVYIAVRSLLYMYNICMQVQFCQIKMMQGIGSILCTFTCTDLMDLFMMYTLISSAVIRLYL